MNRDDIIHMATKCQLVTTGNSDGIYMDALIEFASLVAAEEREACALVCEELDWPGNSAWECGTLDCAAAIRARSD